MSEPAVEVEPIPRSARRVAIAWIASILTAAALLTAAGAKLTAAGPFLREVESVLGPIGKPGKPVVLPIAAAVLFAEITLGFALLLDWHRRSAAAASAVLLGVFLAILLGRWALHGPAVSCTCFGEWWVRSLPVALATDTLLLAAAIAAWRCSPADAEVPRWKTWAGVGTAVTALGSAALVLGFTVVPEDVHEGEDISAWALPADLKIELIQGEHMVAVIDTECPRCRGQWPLMEEIAADREFPPMRAISITDARLTAKFVTDLRTKIPLTPIAGRLRDRFAFIRPPLLLWIVRGKVMAVWSGDFLPDAEEIRRAFRARSPGTL